MNKEYDNMVRTTFLIDTQGNIARVFENIRPAEHSAEVLSALGAAGQMIRQGKGLVFVTTLDRMRPSIKWMV
jgi:hypothetical protein